MNKDVIKLHNLRLSPGRKLKYFHDVTCKQRVSMPLLFDGYVCKSILSFKEKLSHNRGIIASIEIITFLPYFHIFIFSGYKSHKHQVYKLYNALNVERRLSVPLILQAVQQLAVLYCRW
jgi:hypothetical protein